MRRECGWCCQTGRLAGISRSQANTILDQLRRDGIVTVRTAGGVNLCELNRDHLAAAALIELANIRQRAIELIRREVEQWTAQPFHASLYGSFARGDGAEDSGIDILVVAKGTLEEFDDATAASGDRIERATGNLVSWMLLDTDELDHLVAEGAPIVNEWRRDGLRIAGRSIELARRSVA